MNAVAPLPDLATGLQGSRLQSMVEEGEMALEASLALMPLEPQRASSPEELLMLAHEDSLLLDSELPMADLQKQYPWLSFGASADSQQKQQDGARGMPTPTRITVGAGVRALPALLAACCNGCCSATAQEAKAEVRLTAQVLDVDTGRERGGRKVLVRTPASAPRPAPVKISPPKVQQMSPLPAKKTAQQPPSPRVAAAPASSPKSREQQQQPTEAAPGQRVALSPASAAAPPTLVVPWNDQGVLMSAWRPGGRCPTLPHVAPCLPIPNRTLPAVLPGALSPSGSQPRSPASRYTNGDDLSDLTPSPGRPPRQPHSGEALVRLSLSFPLSSFCEVPASML